MRKTAIPSSREVPVCYGGLSSGGCLPAPCLAASVPLRGDIRCRRVQAPRLSGNHLFASCQGRRRDVPDRNNENGLSLRSQRPSGTKLRRASTELRATAASAGRNSESRSRISSAEQDCWSASRRTPPSAGRAGRARPWQRASSRRAPEGRRRGPRRRRRTLWRRRHARRTSATGRGSDPLGPAPPAKPPAAGRPRKHPAHRLAASAEPLHRFPSPQPPAARDARLADRAPLPARPPSTLHSEVVAATAGLRPTRSMNTTICAKSCDRRTPRSTRG